MPPPDLRLVLEAPTLKNIVVIGLAVCFTAGCGSADVAFNQAAQAAIVRSVDSATHAFADAERARDPELVLAHIAPEFYMYVDGRRASYDSVSSQILQTLPSLLSFETTWSDMEVRALGMNHALVTFRFRDRMTDSAGSTVSFVGPTTLIWERRGENWLIIYADADHYPPSPE